MYRPHLRKVPDRMLLADLRGVARRLGARTMTQAVYRRYGRFAPVTPCIRFGSWNAALAAAGLRASQNYRVEKRAILDDIRAVARRLRAERLAFGAYRALGRYGMGPIYRQFGSWRAAAEAAGVVPRRYAARGDRALYDNLEQVWRRLRRQPRAVDLRHPISKINLTAYIRRFGTFQAALAAFVRRMRVRGYFNRSIGCPATSIPPPIEIQHKTKRHLSWRLRYEILHRDDFRCRACGCSPATHANVVLQVDHIKPWSR
ncbi:MAG TPA: hypothetical protein VLI90_01205, partial [Tepidisphaeraceae bacterium]|nr:hypothetical protein [Tepidisphaeraceae bacterium]